MGRDKLLAIEIMRQRIIMDRMAYEKLDNRRVKRINELSEKLKKQKK